MASGCERNEVSLEGHRTTADNLAVVSACRKAQRGPRVVSAESGMEKKRRRL